MLCVQCLCSNKPPLPSNALQVCSSVLCGVSLWLRMILREPSPSLLFLSEVWASTFCRIDKESTVTMSSQSCSRNVLRYLSEHFYKRLQAWAGTIQNQYLTQFQKYAKPLSELCWTFFNWPMWFWCCPKTSISNLNIAFEYATCLMSSKTVLEPVL